MADEKRTVKIPHNVILEDRSKLMVTGVSDVDSFDDQTVVILTEMGELTVRGGNLHISRFNQETGELNLDGNVFALVYTEDRKQQGSFIGRLFR